MIEWLQRWYAEQCNGDWEHDYGVSIGTLDNPGWTVTIDIIETHLEGLQIPYAPYGKSATDWFGYSIKDNVFKGMGDPGKLNKIISAFKEIYESNGQRFETQNLNS